VISNYEFRRGFWPKLGKYPDVAAVRSPCRRRPGVRSVGPWLAPKCDGGLAPRSILSDQGSAAAARRPRAAASASTNTNTPSKERVT